MADNEKNGSGSNSSTKAFGFGGIIGLIALLTGLAAIIQPQRQSISDLKERVDSLYEANVVNGVYDKETNKAIESLDKKFDEVQTRMDWQNDIFNSYVQDQERLNSMLFQKVFPDLKFSPRDYWPLGPARER